MSRKTYVKMDEKLRKIAESFKEFKTYGGSTDDDVLTEEEIEEILNDEQEIGE